nr:hypothetical protein FVER53263_12785 [Fusarium verticillioides]
MLRRPKQKIHLKITDHVDVKEVKEFLVTQMKTPGGMETASKDAMTHENLCTTMALQFPMDRLLSDIGPVSDLELLEITRRNHVSPQRFRREIRGGHVHLVDGRDVLGPDGGSNSVGNAGGNVGGN